MATSYHVYANDGQGGPINYDQPIATVPAASSGSSTGLTLQLGPLAHPSNNLWGVRAFDDMTGIEEANTDARVRLILDAQGNDITLQPTVVVGLVARWSAGSLVLVSWGYTATGSGGPPDHFDVFVGPAGATTTPSGPPTQSVAFLPGQTGSSCTLLGLALTSAWTIRVRAVGPTGLVGPLVMVDLPARSGPTAAVDGLQALATP